MEIVGSLRITEPGIYDLDNEAYHADPCPTMSLSSSGAKTLTHECPALFMHERENRVNKRHFDIGTAGHLMVLEPDLFDDAVTLIPADDFRSNSAKAARDEAYAAGKVPLLAKDVAQVRAMRAALQAHPVARAAFAPGNGKPEQSIFWKDPEFGVWRRSRPDWVPNHGNYLINYKTGTSAHPDEVAKAIWNYGYYQSSAWELDAYEAVTGARPAKFFCVVQAKSPPYLVTVAELDPVDLALGAQQNRQAVGLFAWCLERGEWPDYRMTGPARAIPVSLPAWARRDLEWRASQGLFAAPQDLAA